MKKIVGFENKIGGDGAMVAGELAVDGANLAAVVKIVYPIEKVAEPAFKVIDELVDKVEKLIPGDQTALAAGLKADARAALIKLLSESPA